MEKNIFAKKETVYCHFLTKPHFFLFIENVVLYSFTVVVLIVFYKIPSSYGLVVLRTQTSIRNLNKRESGAPYGRPMTINENSDAELVI